MAAVVTIELPAVLVVLVSVMVPVGETDYMSNSHKGNTHKHNCGAVRTLKHLIMFIYKTAASRVQLACLAQDFFTG
ncbi:uncharacterized protein LAESUDRAFT_113883 [Laetiporus sulphureus 93-53]|uniref:Uncharacterized protein n=1 Tax=Laetiporus sulphureus 93-53 TaxID=1314785 RepID=A0A165EPX1_9APHY|nr:uncharacterized protein LAESUDRAFT_113883 [Laetiporus sulphureus 93-53]KZT07517.1 hypothetical protein LAESUDRAFT_113883 [Laetiporus sulphureus 93-53]